MQSGTPGLGPSRVPAMELRIMSQTNPSARVAVFPGTFDPITLGHMDLIQRGAGLFDELVVGVGDNPEKSSLLTLQERTEIVQQCVERMPNVRVESYRGLTVDFALRCGAEATAQALQLASGGSVDLDVLAIKAIEGFDTVLAIVAMRSEAAEIDERLSGSCLIDGHAHRSAAMAVLDATNRLYGYALQKIETQDGKLH